MNTPKTKPKNDVWMTLAVDPAEETIIVVGFGPSKDKVKIHKTRVTAPYVKAFSVLKEDLGNQLFNWFCTCGIPANHAHHTVRNLGQALHEILIS